MPKITLAKEKAVLIVKHWRNNTVNSRGVGDYTSGKKAKAGSPRVMIMPNFRASKYIHRLFTADLVKSILQYAFPVLVEVFSNAVNRRKVSSGYHLDALRVCSTYRITLNEAVMLSREWSPVDLLTNGVHSFYRGWSTNLSDMTSDWL